MTAGYRVIRVMSRRMRWDAQSRSACWRVEEVPGVLLALDPQGWQLRTRRVILLPDWLVAQMVPIGLTQTYLWSRGPFATRRELLEALRLEDERAKTRLVPAALSEVLS